jgi:metal-responsive CopG/Arc/MetJ family transcriptional regulator
MKVKTSITLPEDLIREMDKVLGKAGNRSMLIERALRDFLRAQKKKVRDTKDLNILNSCADKLNKEAMDVLSYQVDP